MDPSHKTVALISQYIRVISAASSTPFWKTWVDSTCLFSLTSLATGDSGIRYSRDILTRWIFFVKVFMYVRMVAAVTALLKNQIQSFDLFYIENHHEKNILGEYFSLFSVKILHFATFSKFILYLDHRTFRYAKYASFRISQQYSISS